MVTPVTKRRYGAGRRGGGSCTHPYAWERRPGDAGPRVSKVLGHAPERVPNAAEV